MDIKESLDRGLDFFGEVVGQVDAGAWENRTPCEGWNARDLTAHVIGVMRIAVEMLRGAEPGGSLAPVQVGDNPAAEWEQTAATVRAELPGADLDAERETVLGRKPLSFSLTFPTFDLYLHAWDLGQAIGRQVLLPDDVIEWIDAALRQLPPDRMRTPKTFGPEQPAPQGADPTTRLMAFAGRTVMS